MIFKYFDNAIRLMASRKALFLAIIFSIFLPIHILETLVSAMIPANTTSSVQIHFSLLLNSLLIPIYIGAFLFALSSLSRNENDPVRFPQAMRVGLKCWGRLFTARLMTGIYILLGLICFIVPGIFLILRYAFVDAAVVLEGHGAVDAMKRSKELTRNYRGRIFAAGIVFIIGLFTFGIAFFSTLNFFGITDSLLTDFLFNCLLDLALAIFTAVLFLLFREAKASTPASPET
jgi:hypothetical protein